MRERHSLMGMCQLGIFGVCLENWFIKLTNNTLNICVYGRIDFFLIVALMDKFLPRL